MKKYVLNIEKLYTGETANALVLNQVDDETPTLIPSISEDTTKGLSEWLSSCRRIHGDFDPFEHEFEETYIAVDEDGVESEFPISGKFLYRVDSFSNANYVVKTYVRELFDIGALIAPDGYTYARPNFTGIGLINEYIVDFNLNLQNEFKKRGHRELYLLDDTKKLKPRKTTLNMEKTYMHCIDGKALVSDDDSEMEVNSSQMNVMFPYKKMTSKSLYASQLKVEQAIDVDDVLERARGITLQGKISYEKCLNGVAQVGNNMYVMSTNIDVDECNTHIYGNGLTIVNAYLDKPYYFPHSMTLFQPSQGQYDGPNLTSAFRDFIDWYEMHSRRTVVTLNEVYGGNVSTINCIGSGSYEMELATYSPTNLILSSPYGTSETDIGLNSDTFRKMRNDAYQPHEYRSKRYVFDNSIYDGKDVFGNVGIMFNMYDTFITGNDRVLKLHIPKDKDFNKLLLRFGWEVRKDSSLLGDFEATVWVNENQVFVVNQPQTGSYELAIPDTAVDEHDISIIVRIHYAVDFGKRNVEREYRDKLRKSGVVLKNLCVENGVQDIPKRLTFGSYVNEQGISDEEYALRYNQFWLVSQYKKDLTYQTVVETSLKNMTSAGLKYPNNYSSGDLYGDMFVTKSILDPRYDMNMELGYWDSDENKWTDDEKKDLMLRAVGRDYLGMGQCSNQLFLTYSPTDIAIGYDSSDERVFTKRV